MNQDESVKTETKEKVEYREVTAAAVILGIVQGVLMTAAFVYAGLKLGFTLSGSAVAAILGFAVLKGVMRKGTIIENNINQTIASGINIAGSGVIFTLPVLLLMKEEFSIIPMILAGIAGSIMGVTVIIPLRKQMIDLERLRFPSGTAVAAILKSPGAGVEKALLLGSGFLLALITVVLIKKNILPAEIPLGKMWGFPEYTQTAIALSLMNLGAGMLAGKGGLPFAFGGALAFWFMAPVAVTNQWTTGDMVYGDMLRPIGIGMLIGGALMGVVKAFPAVKAAFKTLKSAAATGFKGGDELPSAIYTVELPWPL